MILKYVIIDKIFPIIFPTHISHNSIADGYNVTSAGFIDERGNVYGFSDTLNLQSDINDQKIIDKILKR